LPLPIKDPKYLQAHFFVKSKSKSKWKGGGSIRGRTLLLITTESKVEGEKDYC
jgi:hypothetical protein